MRKHGSSAVTSGVRVDVVPHFLPSESDADEHKFVFSYHITIRNDAERTVQLVSRRWVIVDGDGHRHEVEGEGVVGRQPILEPGQVFEYQSFVPLKTPWGTMEGAFVMQVHDGRTGEPERFGATVARFFLVAQPEPAGVQVQK